MEHIDASVIDKIRKALINRYDRDQQIQQLIEEIGTEEGLGEQDLIVVYQAYLELKERMQYTANLVDLWNQIESVQDRMNLLHTYDRLEEDLWRHDIDIVDTANLQDVPQEDENIENLDNEDFQFIGEDDSDDELNAFEDDLEDEHFQYVGDDEDYDDNAMYYYNDEKQARSNKEQKELDKQKKKIEKLLKKQMKRIEKEWAKISGKSNKDDRKDKSSKKKDKKDKDAKKKDKESKKHKDSKNYKETKDLLKALDKREKKNKKDKSKQEKSNKEKKK